MADQYLKKWAGLPRCATTAIIHLNTALNIKKISTLYKEAHATTHSSTRLKGDTLVNLVIDNRLDRETQFTRKKSVTVQSECIYKTALGRNTVQGEIPGCTPDIVQVGPSQDIDIHHQDADIVKPSAEFISKVNQEVKSLISVEENGKMFEHVQKLVKQGKFLELSKCEQPGKVTSKTFQGAQ